MPHVVFFHPDLGIGGAERLIVDAALALKRRNHKVTIFTAHHDRTHCFPETTNGSLDVRCHMDWLPKNIAGRFMALCAIIRMIFLAIYVRFILKLDYDVALVDQVSACVPFLCGYKFSKVLFYCHYPDLLLTKRKTTLKKFYRYFIDWIESYTTSCADKVLVNSEFTAGVFKDTFPSIQTETAVLYPSLDFSKFDECVTVSDIGIPNTWKYLFLSINRYERKKNLPLALKSFKLLLENIGEEASKSVHMVIAGGYDNRNVENIAHYNELLTLWSKLSLEDHVTFLKSPSDEVKINLLRKSTCLIYTPHGEHFGIVPIEAMYCKTPVIAVNSGGPKETVVNEVTGYLCEQTEESFSTAMAKFIEDEKRSFILGAAGYKRVNENFSFDKFSSDIHNVVMSLASKKLK